MGECTHIRKGEEYSYEGTRSHHSPVVAKYLMLKIVLTYAATVN